MVKEEPNYPLHTLIALFMGVGIVFTVHVAKGRIGLWDYNQSQDAVVNTFTGDSVEQSLVSWGFIFLVLLTLSEFPSTAPLSAAFAWLILIAVIMVNADTLIKISGATPGLGGTKPTGNTGNTGAK